MRRQLEAASAQGVLTASFLEGLMPEHEDQSQILNSPYDEPAEHWNIEEGASPEKRPGRRLA